MSVSSGGREKTKRRKCFGKGIEGGQSRSKGGHDDRYLFFALPSLPIQLCMCRSDKGIGGEGSRSFDLASMSHSSDWLRAANEAAFGVFQAR